MRHKSFNKNENFFLRSASYNILRGKSYLKLVKPSSSTSESVNPAGFRLADILSHGDPLRGSKSAANPYKKGVYERKEDDQLRKVSEADLCEGFSLTARLAPTMSESLHKSGEREPAERGEGPRSAVNNLDPRSGSTALLRSLHNVKKGRFG